MLSHEELPMDVTARNLRLVKMIVENRLIASVESCGGSTASSVGLFSVVSYRSSPMRGAHVGGCDSSVGNAVGASRLL